MKTNKMYWEDSYLDELETIILSINNNEVILKDTIIFSFSGGQESDLGYINEYEVLFSRFEGETIIYTIQDDHNLHVKDKVLLKIDWKIRYQIMRNHLAVELVNLYLEEKYPDLEKIGANVAFSKARVDYIWDGNISEEFIDIQNMIDQVINNDLEIEKGFIDEAIQLRYWKLPGFKLVQCCGTHIKSTKELGCVRLKRKSGGSGKERVEVYTD